MILSFLYAGIWISQPTVVKLEIFEDVRDTSQTLLYKTKAVISAYEIKNQFKSTNLYISKYTSQHTV